MAPPFRVYVLNRLGLDAAGLRMLDRRRRTALIISSVLFRPFTAPSLSQFWWRWNPVLGYFLGKYIYRPSRAILPRSLSVLVTFALSGFLFHDVFFWDAAPGHTWATTTWFATVALGVIVSERINLRFDEWSPKVRVVVHASFLMATRLLAARVRVLLGLL